MPAASQWMENLLLNDANLRRLCAWRYCPNIANNVRKSHSGMLFVLMLALFSSVAPCRDFGDESLRGLTQARLAVVVEPLSSDLSKYLKDADVQNDVEHKLKNAGVLIVSRDEALAAPNRVFLHVDITSRDVDPHTVAAFIAVSLYQPASLSRDPNVKPLAATWNDGLLVICTTDLIGKVRDGVKALADRFAAAYVAANPK